MAIYNSNPTELRTVYSITFRFSLYLRAEFEVRKQQNCHNLNIVTKNLVPECQKSVPLVLLLLSVLRNNSLSCDLSLKNNGGSNKRIHLNLSIFTKLANGEARSFKVNLRIVEKTLTRSQMTIVSAFIFTSYLLGGLEHDRLLNSENA